MKMHVVTFNAVNSYEAELIRNHLSHSGIRLRSHLGRVELDGGPTTSQQHDDDLHGLTMEVPTGMVPAARVVLRELFTNHKYGIHSITVDGQTCCTDQVNEAWWDNQFSLSTMQ